MSEMDPNSAGDSWAVSFTEPDTPPEQLERWHRLRTELVQTARRYGWTKTEVSKRSTIPAGTLWQWFDGSYRGVVGNVSDRLAKWLDSISELSAAAARVPVAPGFVLTPTAQEITDALIYAQMMPEIVVITTGAGMGKTRTVEEFCRTRAHASLVTMRPTTASVHGMLLELAMALDVNERNPAKLDRTIGERLKRNGRHTLLAVDEAQNLSDQAVNQLRFFFDCYGVGIALVGNEELYGRFGGNDGKPAYAQLQRRFGLRFRRMQPLDADVELLINAWAIEDEEVRKLCRAIGRKPGALGVVTKTLQLAGMYAAGDQRPLQAADLKLALQNRGLEDR